MTTNQSLSQIDALIKDAATEISENIGRLQWGSSLDHTDKAETITRFAKALETLMLHKHNISLDPTLAEDEDYVRMVCARYQIDIMTRPVPHDVSVAIWVDTKKIRKAVTSKYGHKIKYMQVTHYDVVHDVHSLVFTMEDGTTHSATAAAMTNLETVYLENLRLTARQLRPNTDFTTKKSKTRYNSLDLTLKTSIR